MIELRRIAGCSFTSAKADCNWEYGPIKLTIHCKEAITPLAKGLVGDLIWLQCTPLNLRTYLDPFGSVWSSPPLAQCFRPPANPANSQTPRPPNPHTLPTPQTSCSYGSTNGIQNGTMANGNKTPTPSWLFLFDPSPNLLVPLGLLGLSGSFHLTHQNSYSLLARLQK